MNVRRVFGLISLLLASTGLLHAGDLTGKWKSEFDSQIGLQKYVYEFKMEEGKLTGLAKYDHSMGKGENKLTDISVTGDAVRFVEKLSFDGMELVVTYSGKFAGEDLHLKREVGEFAVEEIVLKRAKDEAAEAK